jgi:peptidoglycan/xylan/chitin deacetylase (PgdA/CDA1 family)
VSRTAHVFGWRLRGALLLGSVGVAVAIGSAPGSASNLVGHEWSRLPTSQRVVALTFDCGSNAAGVRSILATLGAQHAAATFFLAGEWARAYPTQARQIAAQYPVGNHTLSHPYLTHLSNAAVKAQITRGAEAIHAITGAKTKPLFRFPYGDRNPRTIALAGELGYGSVTWTVDTLGWKGRSAGDRRAIVKRVLARLTAGEIVLMHVGSAPDGSTLDADALPSLLQAIASRGYGFTTLTDYTSAASQTVDDSSRTRFSASAAWKRSSWSPQRYGISYRYARPAPVSDPARFRLRISKTANYLVYARWPASPDYSRAAQFEIGTTAGVRRVRVDQRRDGGRWVYLGSFRLAAGDRFVSVSRITRSPGLVIADAVRLVRRP